MGVYLFYQHLLLMSMEPRCFLMGRLAVSAMPPGMIIIKVMQKRTQ